MGDKGIGVLGETEVNLRDYSEDHFKIIRLHLKKCIDNEAFIEVGLKASVSKNKSNRNSTVLDKTVDSSMTSSGKDQLV